MENRKKSTVLICFLMIALLPRDIGSVPSPRIEEREIAIELLTEESNPDARVRREADSNLPDHLSFQVPMTTGEVTLRMKRSRLLPVVTSRAGPQNLFSKDAAVYTDLESGASMIVRRQDDKYTLQGLFQHEEEQWHVEPLDRVRRHGGSGTKSHTLYKGLPNVESANFIGDAIEDPDPPVEVFNLDDRNRYRQKNLARQKGEGNSPDQREVNDTHPTNETKEMSKRQLTRHIVEMAFIVDHADYAKWVTYKGLFGAIREMTLWYTYVAEIVNICYSRISDREIAINTRVSFFRIMTTDGEDDFIQRLVSFGSFSGSAGLFAFRNWVQNPFNGIPNADHYMYFTGFDIRGAIGIAYLDRVCTATGVSITENDFMARTGSVAAHELGHSLGARHDRDSRSCSDNTNNVMAAVLYLPIPSRSRGNNWRFSSCSIAYFKSYVRRVTCTRRTTNLDRLPAPRGDNRAGIALDRDEQCQQYFRSRSSSYCSSTQNSNGGEGNLCGGMFCRVPGRTTCRTILPLEYTTCGFLKWCRGGLCVGVLSPPPDPQPGPATLFDCFPFLIRLDFLGLLNCFREVLFG